jgi:dihydroneopterin aldolase
MSDYINNHNDKYVRILIRDLETSVRVGIYESEKNAPQPIRLDVDLWSAKKMPLNTPDDFIDYDPIRNLVCDVWPHRPHVELLETLAQELIDFALKDDRIDAVRVRITKPLLKVGIELFHSR